MSVPFKMKGWSPFTKKSPAKNDPQATHPEHHKDEKDEEVSKEVYVDPDRVVTTNVLQDIDKQINTHKTNEKPTKPWADKLKALQTERSTELERIQADPSRN
jgi:hypothetical protein